ncbi:MAG: DUF4390 domain-containing protein [Spirochaetes bacterium]|nr:DUF4390 domain-containing protein [Spirochaetota bacterium]
MKKYFIIVLFCLLPFLSLAQEIKEIKISTNQSYLSISSTLDQPISGEIIDLLKNGVKVTIVYHIQVQEKRPFFLLFDKTLAEKTVKKIVTYNIWEKMFHLAEDEELYKLKSEEELQKKLMCILDVKMIPMSELKEKKNCYIKVRAELESIKLFPPLSWIYDLVITRSFETSWKKKDIK